MRSLVVLFLVFTTILLSCTSRPNNFNPVESNFPLEQDKIIPSTNVIQKVVSSDTWLAMYSENKLAAVDIETQKILWQMDVEIEVFDDMGLQMHNDNLTAVTTHQVFFINRLGEMKELFLDNPDDSIINLFSMYPDYIFVVRFPDWRLEAYSISQNYKMWETPAGRGSVDVFYDRNKNIAYITSQDEFLRAIDIETGKVLWQEDRESLFSAFEKNIIYAIVNNDNTSHYQISGFNVETQRELWAKEISFINYVYNLVVVGDLLIVCGDRGLLAVDKSTGNDIWYILPHEDFRSEPIKFNGLIYAKSIDLKIYAIDPVNGDVIGFVKLEEPSIFSQPMFEVLSGVYNLEDGILINTRYAAVIYKAK